MRNYTVCHSFYIFWRHYLIVKLNCFMLRTTTVAGQGVPIFRVFTVTNYPDQIRQKTVQRLISERYMYVSPNSLGYNDK